MRPFVKALEERITSFASLSDVAFRLLFSPIFVIGGLGHFVRHNDMLDRLADSPWFGLVKSIGEPSLLLNLSGIAIVVFGIGIAFGFLTRLSAVALFVTLVPITLAVHIAPGHTGPLLKNVAILGGLIHFFVRGGGAWSVDRYLARRAP